MPRQKEFNTDEVVIKAMEVFWLKGYEGTSLQDLMAATGLHKGSLYGTFKSKKNLFKESLKKYREIRTEDWSIESDPIQFIKDYFQKITNESLDESRQGRGCLLMNSCVEFGAVGDPELKKLSVEMLGELEEAFAKALELAKAQGQLPSEFEVAKNAQCMLSAAFSICEISKFRREPELLNNICNCATQCLSH